MNSLIRSLVMNSLIRFVVKNEIFIVEIPILIAKMDLVPSLPMARTELCNM